MSVSARMKCNLISHQLWAVKLPNDENGNAKKVVLNPVFTGDKDDPNYSYSEATPAGELMLWITNPNAYNYFKQGKTYDITITEREEQ